MKHIFNKIPRITFIALFLCLGMSGIVSAQEETSATVTGQVTDSTGAVIANANIVVTNTATGQSRTVQSNDDGLYSVFPLIPGTYTITVGVDDGCGVCGKTITREIKVVETP